jgi:perosamine synthetase
MSDTNKPRRISVGAPVLAGREKDYVLDCLESNWISSQGKYLTRFETEYAKFCGTRFALACCNGTTALHLALMAFGIGPGDEVLVPSLTYIATANAVTYCGARPVFVDSEPRTGNLDPALIEGLVTPRTKGIVVVHLYGHPADMDPIRRVAERHGLFVLEDAAEAHGATYRGRKAGALADAATFSFYGNKILSCGEGGMVTTDRADLAERVELLKGQGMDLNRRYWFTRVGYNYRMTNVAAAIGLAQLEKAEWHFERHHEVARWYRLGLKDCPSIQWQEEEAWATHAHWMVTIFFPGMKAEDRDELRRKLAEAGIETRPVFYPLHILPPYREAHGTRPMPVSEKLGESGINLPSSAALSEDDVAYVCENLKRILATG